MSKVGKLIKSESTYHQGYEAGSGSIDTNTYECPCGKGEYVVEKDNIPGFRDKTYELNCEDCTKKYDFNFNTGEMKNK